ncbi:substrate-binding and VWA domain-containing protein [Streptomyces nigrescens]|uniref:Substrate-binding and VWA domain-containing protein n=1 Tax=Streptomyces nigrescens TaxID=1920 RepID=A0ABY7JBL4_STRNI|nr:substrate-binding and VWA domain-containing protein [Streptomyces nigrescens]WAU08425.1 substrate-binding and VWA domain-containing protein [Streptomyces nigrescens]
MGRHSLPDAPAPARTGARRGARPRALVLATGLVLTVAAGTVVALDSGLLPFGGPCDGEATRLDVAASPDIAPAIEAVAKSAREGATRTDGRCLDVKVTARAAHEIADAFGQRPVDPEFQVWIPDSSLWVDRVEAERGTPLTAAGTLASSPIALGAVPRAAKSLGWPAKTYTWTELTRATASGDALRLGVADPSHSATGLLSLARISAAHAKEAPDHVTADTRTAATARLLNQRVADGDGQAMATLPRDGSGKEQDNPRRNQALLLSEQAAFAHNTRADGGPDLDLIYPEGGTARLDYPYTLVDNSETGPEQSRAANRFMTLLSEPAGQRALRRHGFRAANGEADPKVVTTAGGRDPQPYSAAPAEPPAVKELQALMGMWTITVQSARLSTVVDASTSMGAPVPGHSGRSRMDLAKNSLLQALTTFTSDDEIGLWKFATTLDGDKDYVELSPTERLGGRDEDGSSHREALADAFRALAPQPQGATGLYDTTLAAYEEARSAYASGKFNALVIVTDGTNDDAHGIGLDALVGKLEKLSDPKRPVPLIALAIGPQADTSALDRIVKPTGGSTHLVSDPSQIHQVMLKAIMAAGSNGPR